MDKDWKNKISLTSEQNSCCFEYKNTTKCKKVELMFSSRLTLTNVEVEARQWYNLQKPVVTEFEEKHVHSSTLGIDKQKGNLLFRD